jgi:hypothetical protein
MLPLCQDVCRNDSIINIIFKMLPFYQNDSILNIITNIIILIIIYIIVSVTIIIMGFIGFILS